MNLKLLCSKIGNKMIFNIKNVTTNVIRKQVEIVYDIINQEELDTFLSKHKVNIQSIVKDRKLQMSLSSYKEIEKELSSMHHGLEEDIFSKTDLYDFKANLEGAQKIYNLFKAHLIKKDAKLAKEIEAQFANVNKLLEKHNKSKNGYEYVGYDKLSKADIKELAEAVNKLGEPLSKMGVILS